MTALAVNATLALFVLWLLVRAKADAGRALRWLGRKWPHFTIEKVQPDGTKIAYLRRYFIVNTRWFRVYLHNIAHEDDDRDPHDHPCSFFTLVLRGGYTNEWWLGCSTEDDPEHTWPGDRYVAIEEKMRPGTIRFRKAEHTHRVRDVLPNTWTLTIWGRYRRDWGFRDEKWQWIHWRKYLGIEGDYAAD